MLFLLKTCTRVLTHFQISNRVLISHTDINSMTVYYYDIFRKLPFILIFQNKKEIKKKTARGIRKSFGTYNARLLQLNFFTIMYSYYSIQKIGKIGKIQKNP